MSLALHVCSSPIGSVTFTAAFHSYINTAYFSLRINILPAKFRLSHAYKTSHLIFFHMQLESWLNREERSLPVQRLHGGDERRGRASPCEWHNPTKSWTSHCKHRARCLVLSPGESQTPAVRMPEGLPSWQAVRLPACPGGCKVGCMLWSTQQMVAHYTENTDVVVFFFFSPTQRWLFAPLLKTHWEICRKKQPCRERMTLRNLPALGWKKSDLHLLRLRLDLLLK